jgi:hypothetical protein
MLTKKEFIFLGIMLVVVVVVVVVIVFLPINNDNSKSNSDNEKTLPPNTPPPTPPPTPPIPTEELSDPVKMDNPGFDFSNFEIMNEMKEKKEELFCYYSDEFRYGSASNCGLIDFRYEVILLELKTKPTEWKVIVAIRQYDKDKKLIGVQYFESKPVPGDVSCLINDSFVEKYYKLCDTTVDECVTQADKAKVGYDGTTCPEEFYVDVEYVLIKKLGDITSQGCVPKNFKINKSSSTGEVIFSNNSEDSDGKKYKTKNIKIKK